MSIRYHCKECESTLTIRDDKAGKPAKCPKCQAEFIVPLPEESSEEKKDSETSQSSKSGEQPSVPKSPSKSSKSSPASKAPSASGKQKSSSAKSGKKKKPVEKPEEPKEFDPAEFLLDGNDGGAPSATVPPTPPPAPKASAPKPVEPKAGKKKAKPEKPTTPIASNRPKDMETLEESEEEKRSRLKEVYGSTSADIAASALSNTSDSAEILLDAAMDDSRRKAAQEIEEQKEGPDYKEAATYFGKQYGLPILGIIVGFIVLYWASDYMMGGGLKIPPLGKVSGVVKLDGKPLANATVTFIPVSEEGGVRENVRAAMGVTNDEGEFVLQYTEGVRGTAVGKNRVEISAMSSQGTPVILPGYGSGSREIREVESGSQEIDFAISTQ